MSESICPKCKQHINHIAPGKTRLGMKPQTIDEAIAEDPGLPIDCGHCGYELYDGRGNKRSSGRGWRAPRQRNRDALKKTYVRETQLKSEDGYVHYGMLNKLQERGYEVPRDFSGNSHALAMRLGITHEELARLWKTSTSDLRRRGNFTLSD